VAAPAALRILALVVLAGPATACGGSHEPERELQQGTFTIGSVIATDRDSIIARGAEIGVAEVNNAGGVGGRVKLRLKQGPNAERLVDGGAQALILPCEARDEGEALGDVRRAPVLTFATCNNDPAAGQGNLPLTAPWGVGPDVSDRAAMLAALLHERQFQRAAIVPGGAAEFLKDAVEAWGIQVVAQQPEGIVTDGDWKSVDELRGFPVYGLDRLDSAKGIRTTGLHGSEGRIFATFGYPSPGSKLDEVYERYRLAHGARPDGSEVGLGFDAVRVLSAAMDEASAADPVEMAAALPGLEVPGAGGVLNYEENGSRRPRADVALVEVRSGRLDLLKRGRPERP
jgi:branched-chain amino acid transport system substrate-binding protein